MVTLCVSPLQTEAGIVEEGSMVTLCVSPLQTEAEENPVSQEGVPPGFEAISLVEALNGQVVPQNGQTDGEISLYV